MSKRFVTDLTSEEIRIQLRKMGYPIELNHVFPREDDLPEDYPRNYNGFPLPCAWVDKRGLEFVNEGRASVREYHERIRDVLDYKGD